MRKHSKNNNGEGERGEASDRSPQPVTIRARKKSQVRYRSHAPVSAGPGPNVQLAWEKTNNYGDQINPTLINDNPFRVHWLSNPIEGMGKKSEGALPSDWARAFDLVKER